MDNHEIDTLVQTVLRQMGYAGGAAPVNVAPAATATAPARAVTPSSSTLLSVGSASTAPASSRASAA